jgi:hypothetical protein
MGWQYIKGYIGLGCKDTLISDVSRYSIPVIVGGFIVVCVVPLDGK